jgi:hypothetical protein
LKEYDCHWFDAVRRAYPQMSTELCESVIITHHSMKDEFAQVYEHRAVLDLRWESCLEVIQDERVTDEPNYDSKQEVNYTVK